MDGNVIAAIAAVSTGLGGAGAFVVKNINGRIKTQEKNHREDLGKIFLKMDEILASHNNFKVELVERISKMEVNMGFVKEKLKK